MRTTLTLDDGIAARLKALARRRGTSFREVVDSVLRRGLAAQERSAPPPAPFRTATFRSALRPGVDPAKLNQLVDELEARRLPGRR